MIPTIKIKSTHPPTQGDFVEINESDFDPAKHERYEAPPAAPVDPVKSTGDDLDVTGDPLASLPADWRDAAGRGITKLKAIAEAVTGRTPADKVEAVAMIDEALKQRDAAKNPPPPAGNPPPPPPPV
jgi:hypothetical protein